MIEKNTLTLREKRINKEPERRFESVLEEVIHPNNSSIWTASSEYAIIWEGNFEGENTVQALLYHNQELYGSLVSSTLNDGSVFCQIDSTIPTDDTYQIQIALLPDKETTIWSDSFIINGVETSSTSIVTSAGVILYICTFGILVYLLYTFNRWRKKQEDGVINALKSSVKENIINSPFGKPASVFKEKMINSPFGKPASFRFVKTPGKKNKRNSMKIVPVEGVHYSKLNTNKTIESNCTQSYDECKDYFTDDDSLEIASICLPEDRV